MGQDLRVDRLQVQATPVEENTQLWEVARERSVDESEAPTLLEEVIRGESRPQTKHIRANLPNVLTSKALHPFHPINHRVDGFP